MAPQVYSSHGDTDANVKAGDGGQAMKGYIWETTDALEKDLSMHRVPVHRNQYLSLDFCCPKGKHLDRLVV